MAPSSPSPSQEPTDRDIQRRRRGRNIAVLLVLLAMSGLFYAIAIVKLGHNAIRSY